MQEVPRYLVNFNSKDIDEEMFDVIIIGSGIAGVYTALCLPDHLSVAILTKEEIHISNSVLAQGGIAVSLGKKDSPELHFRDTITAGAGLCHKDTVRVLVNNAESNINRLCNYGVSFDKEEQGSLCLSREAAHSTERIVHVGDATGKEVCDILVTAVKKKNNVKIFEKVTAVDFLTQEGRCRGVVVFKESRLVLYLADVVICAAGGYGQLYQKTTNPEVATGDGIAMAYRAGAELMDLEFVQFHPTVLYHPENKSFLISEAVRGEGAVLKNIQGERFMPSYHHLAELAPRDVVSRAIFDQLRKTDTHHVYLDITFKNRDFLKTRFPTIFKTCLDYGIDISKDYIPVAPAEHYCMGGIRTDHLGRTGIKGLFACGEAACNGIHGANRLASNSLLEGLVFGRNIAKQVEVAIQERAEQSFAGEYQLRRERKEIDTQHIKESLRHIMDRDVAITRDRQGMIMAKNNIEMYSEMILNVENINPDYIELQNMILVSGLVINSALKREESRGAHFRSDFPETDDVNWQKNIVVSRGNVYVEPLNS